MEGVILPSRTANSVTFSRVTASTLSRNISTRSFSRIITITHERLTAETAVVLLRIHKSLNIPETVAMASQPWLRESEA
jgi:hypothetical protein